MRYLNEEVKPFFVLLEKCFVYGIQGGNNLSDEGCCVVGCNYNGSAQSHVLLRIKAPV